MAALQGIDSGLLSAEPSAYHALREPEKFACIDLVTDERITYGELAGRVARASFWLDARIGDPIGARVAVLARNSIDEVVLCLACQRSGAIFVPLNWRLTGEELALLIADCTPALVIASDEFAAAAKTAIKAAAESELVALKTFSAEAATSRPTAPAELPASAPVTLLYTSGTTGRPKGAIVTAPMRGLFRAQFRLPGRGRRPFRADARTGRCSIPSALFAVLRTAMTLGAHRCALGPLRTGKDARGTRRRADLGITHYFACRRWPQCCAQPGFDGAVSRV